MTFGKRQLVIASLVVALGAAVYLNWQFSEPQELVETETEASSVKQLGQTTYVNTELKTESSQTDKVKQTSQTSKPAQTVSTQPDKGHFAEERARRDKGNEQAMEIMTDIIESDKEDETRRSDTMKSAEKLSQTIKSQTDIENEIRLKGFQDAFVTINNDSCSVSVFGKELDDAAAIMIKDLVNRQTGISFENITISQVHNEGK